MASEQAAEILSQASVALGGSRFPEVPHFRSLTEDPSISVIKLSPDVPKITGLTASEIMSKWLGPFINDPDHPLLLKDCTMFGMFICPQHASWALFVSF